MTIISESCVIFHSNGPVILNDFPDIPISKIDTDESLEEIKTELSSRCDTTDKFVDNLPVICVCRRGNDSQVAVKKLADKLKNTNVIVKDITGGLTAWSKSVNPEFPMY